MNRTKAYTTALYVSIAAMLLLGVALAFLPGESRDYGDYTSRERAFLWSVVTLEVLSIFLTVFFAFRIGRLNRGGQPARPREVSSQEKVLHRRGAILRIGGWVAALLFSVLGIFLGKRWETLEPSPVYISLGVACALPPLLLLVSVVLARRFARSLNEKRVEEMQQVLRTQR